MVFHTDEIESQKTADEIEIDYIIVKKVAEKTFLKILMCSWIRMKLCHVCEIKEQKQSQTETKSMFTNTSGQGNILTNVHMKMFKK